MKILETIVHTLFDMEHIGCKNAPLGSGALMLMNFVDEEEGYIEYKCPFCDEFVLRVWFNEEVQ